MHGSIEEFIIFFILHQVFRVEEINVFLKQFFFFIYVPIQVRSANLISLQSTQASLSEFICIRNYN